MAETLKLAVLIDADNAKSENVEPLMAEIAKYGVASVKRAYGNWTTPNLGGWKQVLVEQSIQPMQQFSYTVGKNSTDSALIIDAMDLLYTGRFGGFCLVSSDSDFTRLAQRIREAGHLVFGFGERKTPTSLVKACDKFVYMDLLREPPAERSPNPSEPRPPRRSDTRIDTKLQALIKASVDAASDDEGWANLGAIGNHLSKREPDFDSRNYGYRKLSDLLRALPQLEWDERKSADGKSRAVLLRFKGGAGSSEAVADAPSARAQAVDRPAPARPAEPAATKPQSSPSPAPQAPSTAAPQPMATPVAVADPASIAVPPPPAEVTPAPVAAPAPVATPAPVAAPAPAPTSATSPALPVASATSGVPQAAVAAPAASLPVPDDRAFMPGLLSKPALPDAPRAPSPLTEQMTPPRVVAPARSAPVLGATLPPPAPQARHRHGERSQGGHTPRPYSGGAHAAPSNSTAGDSSAVTATASAPESTPIAASASAASTSSAAPVATPTAAPVAAPRPSDSAWTLPPPPPRQQPKQQPKAESATVAPAPIAPPAFPAASGTTLPRPAPQAPKQDPRPAAAAPAAMLPTAIATVDASSAVPPAAPTPAKPVGKMRPARPEGQPDAAARPVRKASAATAPAGDAVAEPAAKAAATKPAAAAKAQKPKPEAATAPVKAAKAAKAPAVVKPKKA